MGARPATNNRSAIDLRDALRPQRRTFIQLIAMNTSGGSKVEVIVSRPRGLSMSERGFNPIGFSL